MEILFWIWVLTWLAKRSAEDVLHAVKGTPNPRYELKKAKAKAAGQPVRQQPRYGGKEWFADLLSDAMAANTEKRRASAKAKAQSVDDMVDLVREPKRPIPKRRVYDPNGTRDCSVCEGEVVLDGSPCPACLARQRQRNAEWEAEHGEPEWLTPDRDEMDEPTSVVHDDQHPYCLEPCGPTCLRFGWLCGFCGTEKKHFTSRREAELSHQMHVCRPTPTADETLAQVIQFPSIKKIEKEITMPNSEVTGLSTAIAYADAVSKAHESFTSAGAEGYVGALEQGGNGAEVVSSAREAMEASSIAAARWSAHRAVLEQQMTVKEAYQSQPDAGNKDFVLNG